MWVLSFWFHSRNKKTKCESLFILWGLWVSSTTAEAWVKMRAYMYIKELIKSGINLDSASLFQSRCQSVDQNTYMGQKIPIKVTSLCSQTAFHTLRSQTTLLKFLKTIRVCAKLPQCWSSPDNISMISNILMIFWSFGGCMSIWGVQSLKNQSFFSPHISSSARQKPKKKKKKIAYLSTSSHCMF